MSEFTKAKLRRKLQKRANFRTGTTTDALTTPKFTPHSVHTHARQPTYSAASFDEFVQKVPPLVIRTDSDSAYQMADYCTHGQTLLATVISVLDRNSVAGNDILTPLQQNQLRVLRCTWQEHLRANVYTLWSPPPSAGGNVMQYSLAMQLWLLIAHSNVILQLCNSTGDLFSFYPPAHDYLLRNGLVVENACVMQYPLRTLMLALECFVNSLDQLDRYEPVYICYAVALEHRLSEFICYAGSLHEWNAREWCAPIVKATAQKGSDAAAQKNVALSDACRQYSLVYLLTIYWYAERYEAVHNIRVMRRDSLSQEFYTVRSRVPMHTVARSAWVPSSRSMRRVSDFLCQYAHGLVDDAYGKAARLFLLEFELRPGELDLFRLLQNNNNAFVQSAVEHEFMNANKIARAFINKIYYDRQPYAYFCEYLQWNGGDQATTQSAPFGRQNFVRELIVVYLIDQFITSKYQVPWRQRFMLFHRDPAFATSLERSRTLPYPIIIQQFARFSVLVPHRRAPEQDIADVLQWRAAARARRFNQTAPPSPAGEREQPMLYRHNSRAYDCPTMIDAFAVWALWFLQLTDGAVDANTNMKDFLLELLGWN